MFIVHGEETTAVEFAEHVKNDVGFDALAPYSGDAYDLLTGEQIAQGSRQLVEKKTQGVYRAKSGAFDRLMIAGERLIAVIKNVRAWRIKILESLRIRSIRSAISGTGKFEGKAGLKSRFFHVRNNRMKMNKKQHMGILYYKSNYNGGIPCLRTKLKSAG